MSILRPTSSLFRKTLLTTTTRQSPKLFLYNTHRTFTTTSTFKMPETLSKSTIDQKNDPSTEAQWDTTTPVHQQFEELYGIVDKLKVSLMTTIRPGVGPVSRSMAVSKRVGPDFLYLSNNHSTKFKDLDNDKTVQITFQDSSTQNWVSITGTATQISNSDPRVKELYSPAISAWFGDLGDGVHNGTADDPRMTLIEVKAKYIAYWKSTSTMLGQMKEVAQAAITGSVAQTGVQRQLKEAEIEKARSMA